MMKGGNDQRAVTDGDGEAADDGLSIDAGGLDETEASRSTTQADEDADEEEDADGVTSSPASDVPMVAAVLIGTDSGSSPIRVNAMPVEAEEQPAQDDQQDPPVTPPDIQRVSYGGGNGESVINPADPLQDPVHVATTVLHVEVDGDYQGDQRGDGYLTSRDELAADDQTGCLRTKRRRLIVFGSIAVVAIIVGSVVAVVETTGSNEDIPLRYTWSVQEDGLPPLSNAFPNYGFGNIENLEDCINFCDDVSGVLHLGFAYFFPNENSSGAEEQQASCICYRFVSCVNFGTESREGIVRSAAPLPRTCDE